MKRKRRLLECVEESVDVRRQNLAETAAHVLRRRPRFAERSQSRLRMDVSQMDCLHKQFHFG